MKPPAFEYSAPESLDAALGELEAGDGDARPLGGGQSLVPLLNFRLGAPGVLVDLRRIPELVDVSIDDAAITVRAMTPTARLLSAEVAAASPVLAASARLVGHPQIRSRGTVGGSIAHADPAAELPAVALLLGASIEISGRCSQRWVPADDFFRGLYETACEWDELVSAVRFPRLPAGRGWGFREFARRPGDFALAGVGTTLALDGETIQSTRVVGFGLETTPVRVRAAEQLLIGRVPTAAVLAEARAALSDSVDPRDMLHGSGRYRRHLAGVMFERAIGDALRTAREGTAG